VSSQSLYSGFIRVRVGGLYIEEGKLLLVKLKSPISGDDIWIPPGGGVDYKESLESALIREFYEETSLEITVGDLLFTSELIEREFHVLEFFFEVFKEKGVVRLGIDPEHDESEQLLSGYGFFSKEEIQKLNIKPEYLKTDFWDSKERSLFFRNR